MKQRLSTSSFKLVARLLVMGLLIVLLTQLLNRAVYRRSEPEMAWRNVYDRHLHFDVIAFGNSHNFCTINTPMLSVCGLSAVNIGAPTEFFPQTYYNVLEVLKYQQPKVILLELNSLQNDDVKVWEKRLNYIYRGLFGMKLSVNRIRSMLAVLPPSHYLPALVPLIAYHQNWQDYDQFWQNYQANTAAVIEPHFNSRTHIIDDQAWEELPNTERLDAFQLDVEPRKIPAGNLKKLAHLVEVCRQKGVDLILYKSPVADDRVFALGQRFHRIEAELGVNILDFNFLLDELQLGQNDFYNDSHLNLNGANKVSLYLIEHVLRDRYGLACDPQALDGSDLTRQLIYDRVADDTYHFSVAHYRPDLSYRFVIDKNKTRYEQTAFSRTGSLTVTFTEPGTYTVAYVATAAPDPGPDAPILKTEPFELEIKIGQHETDGGQGG